MKLARTFSKTVYLVALSGLVYGRIDEGAFISNAGLKHIKDLSEYPGSGLRSLNGQSGLRKRHYGTFTYVDEFHPLRTVI